MCESVSDWYMYLQFFNFIFWFFFLLKLSAAWTLHSTHSCIYILIWNNIVNLPSDPRMMTGLANDSVLILPIRLDSCWRNVALEIVTM